MKSNRNRFEALLSARQASDFHGILRTMMDIKDRILYEDNHLIIVNKLSSEIVQGDKTGDETLGESIRRMIKIRDRKPGNVFLGVTHRLDRPTSGIVIFAKTSKALSRMNKVFREHDLKKIYWAVLETSPPDEEGTWTDYLRRDRSKNRSYLCKPGDRDAQKAQLSYKIICRSRPYVLAEIDLLTGRHHQIRAQFSGRGFPVRGDVKYGARESGNSSSISLHARSVSFTHPVSKEPLLVTAPVPRNDLLWRELEDAVTAGKAKTDE